MKTLGSAATESRSLAAAAPEDGCQVFDRLRRAGLRLFAEQGFAKTSIRQIASEAHANVAAVSYYFGDKAGLYRDVSRLTDSTPQPGTEAGTGEPASLDALFGHFLLPLKQGAQVRLWVKLYRREMLEPTGLWQEKIDQDLRPIHARLLDLLCQRLGLARADDEVQRLAITLIGLAVHPLIACDFIDLLAPELPTGPGDFDVWRERLVRYAEALIEVERDRRGKATPAAAGLPDPSPEPTASAEPRARPKRGTLPHGPAAKEPSS